MPPQVTSLRSSQVKAVSCGERHTLVIVEYAAYSFGSGENGQLGLGPGITFAAVPTLVPRVQSAAALSAPNN